jgi:hypothetical protein
LRAFSPIPSNRLLPFTYNDDRVDRIIAEETYVGFDKDLGWTHAPKRERRSAGQVFRTNSKGMRADREYTTETRPGVSRLAAFGDSFTHCSEVTQRDCWAVLLEHALPGTEVLSFGVSAYGPDQAWLRYQRDGRPYRPCGVLIGYYVGDIDRVVNRFRPFLLPDDGIVMSKPRFLLDGDGLKLLPNPATKPKQFSDPLWVEQTLGQHDAWYFPGTFIAGPLDGSWVVRLARTAAYRQARAPLLRDERSYPLYGEDREAYQITGRILIQFAEQVRSEGATPTVVVFPGRQDLLASLTGSKPHDRLVSWLTGAGIPTVDMTESILVEAQRIGFDPLFAAHGHYTDIGNRIVAGKLAHELPEIMSATCEG